MPEGFVANWVGVSLAAGIGLAAMIGMFVASRILAPRRPSAIKDMPYECGIPPAPHSWSQLKIRYYIFAIFFLIFDVEAVFLFAWAPVFLTSVPLVFYEMLIFIGILFFGIIYGWRKGVLKWN